MADRLLPKRQRAMMLERLHQAYPDAKTELQYETPFQLLMAVVLSAQSTDRMVNRVTAPLFTCIRSPAELLKQSLPDLEEALRCLGLWRSKARHLYALAQKLLLEHEGEVPLSFDALLELPGVGRKTAAVVLNTLLGLPYVAVDTHVFRVTRRTHLAVGRDVVQIERALMRLYTPQERLLLHHRLVLHGRYVCRALRPKCERCVLADLCPSAC